MPSPSSKMTLEEFYATEEIDLSFILDKFYGSYWESCYEFIEKNWKKDVSKLSEKQLGWAHKILEDCVEKRIEG